MPENKNFRKALAEETGKAVVGAVDTTSNVVENVGNHHHKKHTRKKKKHTRKKKKLKKKTQKKLKKKTQKKMKGGTSLARNMWGLNPFAIPEVNIFHVHHKTFGHTNLEFSQIGQFANKVSDNYPNSDGKVKIYLLLSFIGGGLIFHPIIAISGKHGIHYRDNTFQLLSDEDDGKAYISVQEILELCEDSSINIRSLVYIGYFNETGVKHHNTEAHKLLLQLDEYAERGTSQYVQNDHFDEYYSLRDNNCQTFVKKILSDLQDLLDKGIFVSPFYRKQWPSGNELHMVDIDITQLNKNFRGALNLPIASLGSVSESASGSVESVSRPLKTDTDPTRRNFTVNDNYEDMKNYAKKIGVDNSYFKLTDAMLVYDVAHDTGDAKEYLIKIINRRHENIDRDNDYK